MARILIVLALIASPALAADASRGKAVFMQQCSICHTAVAGAPPGIGPSLFGVVNRKPGSLPGYAYSSAMRNAGTSWSPERLDTYIESPQKTIPGIKMPYAGLKYAAKRQDLIAHLETLK